VYWVEVVVFFSLGGFYLSLCFSGVREWDRLLFVVVLIDHILGETIFFHFPKNQPDQQQNFRVTFLGGQLSWWGEKKNGCFRCEVRGVFAGKMRMGQRGRRRRVSLYFSTLRLVISFVLKLFIFKLPNYMLMDYIFLRETIFFHFSKNQPDQQENFRVTFFGGPLSMQSNNEIFRSRNH